MSYVCLLQASYSYSRILPSRWCSQPSVGEGKYLHLQRGRAGKAGVVHVPFFRRMCGHSKVSLLYFDFTTLPYRGGRRHAFRGVFVIPTVAVNPICRINSNRI